MSIHKKFPITSWAVENKTTIYVLTALILIIGALTYSRLPKEQFPDIVVPTILVTTINSGTSPVDVENLITRQIEKQIKSVADVKKVTSQSLQDASIIVVEFTTDISPTVAKQRVTDAVDRSKADLPTDLTQGPDVQEIDFSEFPIMFVNIAGEIGLDNLKRYADDLQDQIESMSQIRRVDIIGALEKRFALIWIRIGCRRSASRSVMSPMPSSVRMSTSPVVSCLSTECAATSSSRESSRTRMRSAT